MAFKFSFGIVVCLSFFLLGAIVAAGDDIDKQSDVETKRYYVGRYTAKIVPEHVRVYMAPSPGYLSGVLNVAENDRIRKGTIIAKINEEEILREKEELEVSFLREDVSVNEETNQLIREREDLLFEMGLSKEEKKFAKNTYSSEEENERVIKLLDDKLELLKKERQINQKRKREEFKKKEESYIIEMPYDGRIQYPFLIKDELRDDIYIENGKEIVTVCDDSAFYLTVMMTDPEITKMETEDLVKTLVLEAEFGSGNVAKAVYSHRRVTKTGGGGHGYGSETLTFYFRMDDEYKDLAYNALGVNLITNLYYVAIANNVEALNIGDLAKLPEASDAKNWRELLKTINPAYELLLVGETQLIVQKNELDL